MSNLRRLRRKISRNGHITLDNRPGAYLVTDEHPQAGAYNAYRCPVCDLYTVVRHADPGDTPYFIRCRATENCDGKAQSLGYPGLPMPPKLISSCRYEWYRPNYGDPILEVPGLQEEIEKGSLALREIE